MKKILITVLLALVVSETTYASADASYFPYMKKLTPPENAKRDVATFVVDEEMFAETDNDYANLRVYGRDKAETPSLVRSKRKKRSEIREYSVSMRQIAFKTLPDNMIQVILEQVKHDEKSFDKPEAIVFSTKMQNYEKEVTVYGSSNQNKWDLLAEKQPVFDYTRFIDIRNSKINIKKGGYKYYKIEISNISESQQSPYTTIARESRKGEQVGEIEEASFKREDFRIDNIAFKGTKPTEVKTSGVTTEYSVKDFAVVHDGKKTLVTFSTACTPLTSLEIVTSDSNFSRGVMVEGSDSQNDEPSWCRISMSNVSRIRMGKFNQEHTTIHLSKAQRYSRYRITIQNLDSPALDITCVKAVGEVHEVVFFCKAPGDCRVLYGGENIKPPQYDIADVLRKTEGEDADTYSPGKQEENLDYSGAKTFRFKQGKALLIIMVLLMVATLAWAIVKAIKNVDSMAKE